jgi:dTDP-4-amino-4,6-dideoxygalactose transaminase
MNPVAPTKGASKVDADFLPYARQTVTEEDVIEVTRCLRGDWLTSGPAIPAFEEALTAFAGCAEAVACSSGTAALHLAYASLDVRGKAVIVPAITFAATANAARYAGAYPVFADIDPETGLLTPETLQNAIERAAATGHDLGAIAPVSLTGRAINLEELRAVAGGIPLVEDAAHSLGAAGLDATGATVRSGSCVHSERAIFSFHPVKSVCAAEGGAVLLNDPAEAERLRRLRDHGMQRGVDPDRPWRMAQVELGFPYRLTDLQATLGRSQLGRQAETIASRRQVVRTYLRAFGEKPFVSRIRLPFPDPGQAWHLFVVHFADGDERDAACHFFRERGIGTQVHYLPVYQHPDYASSRRTLPDGGLPGAEAWFRGCLSLPLFAHMPEGAPERVIETLADFLRRE